METQEELCEKLLNAGFQVTQATVSRDIRELRLTKVLLGNGKQKYIIVEPRGNELLEKYVKVLVSGLVSLEQAENILVLKTVSGMAMAVAAAIDNLEIEGVVGCIAGDDTIMCAVKNADMVKTAIEHIRQLTNH